MKTRLGILVLSLSVFFTGQLVWGQDTDNNNKDHNTLVIAQQIMNANPEQVYWEEAPDVLFAIPIFRILVNADGRIQDVIVLRTPNNPAAIDTVDLALKAIKKAEPFQNLITDGKTIEIVQTFLFKKDRKFKIRILDGQK